ncbi:MAG: hypothetical protein U0797_07865 [Gemmataceae bacterium]
MRAFWTLLLAPLVAAGCAGGPTGTPGPANREGAGAVKSATTADREAEVRAGLAKLPPEDRKLAEQQKFCAARGDSRLGLMGPPHKVTVKGEPFFLCCKGCEDKALSDPEATLARAKELRAKSATPPPN